MKKIIFTKEEIANILDLYKNQNKSQKFIGEQYNVSRTVIKRILRENLEQEQFRKKTYKYYANYDTFKNIDSEEKAYWLGFIAADGCVYQRAENASLIINIHERDAEHLEKFKKFMNTNANVIHHVQNKGFSNNTPMVKIVLNNTTMIQDIIDKGVCPRKSLTLKPPKIDKKYFLSYILGYFDGDGSISELKNKEFSISLVGTKETLEWINSLLSISNFLEKRSKNDKNCYYIRCGGCDKPYSIMKRLYDSSPVNLTRKYEKFKKLETVVLNRNIK